MRRVLSGVLAACAVMPLAAPAHAGGGDFAAGVFGGLAAGAIIGSSRPYYDPPPPPAYYYGGPRYEGSYCHFEPGRRYWDDYQGVWRYSRIRVCD
jgi:hypothetical protein